MPYFLILPGFVLYVAGMSALVVGTWLYQPAAGFRPYLLSILLWSSLTFIVSTIAYALVMVACSMAMERLFGGRPSAVGGVLMGLVIFVGPFVAAGAGLVGGGVFGAWRVRRSSRKAS